MLIPATHFPEIFCRKYSIRVYSFFFGDAKISKSLELTTPLGPCTRQYQNHRFKILRLKKKKSISVLSSTFEISHIEWDLRANGDNIDEKFSPLLTPASLKLRKNI